jgi:uncharacterized repeat protein (TIGR04076 family)
VNAHYGLSMKFVAFHAVGVALAAVLLLGVVGGGFLAGLLLIPLVVAGMGALAIAHRMTRRRGTAAPPATAAVLSRAEEARAQEVAMVARVTEAEGVCPRGYRFYVGQNWRLNGDMHGDTEACPMAAGKLADAAASLRSDGESSVGMAMCQTGQHRVVFQLSRQDEASEEPNQPS